MKKMVLLLSLLLSSLSFAQDISTVSSVDVSRYVGKWYAHYSLPQFFTRSCRAQTAEYEVIDEKTISVFNTCLKQKGEETISGKAVVTNTRTNAELEVTFNNFFTRLFRVKGDYNIIALDDQYEHVLVGSRDRKSLWFMSRSEIFDEATASAFLKKAKAEGFDISKLVKSKF